MRSLFESFLPFRNPIGFGAADFLQLFLAAVVLCLTIARGPWIERYWGKLAEKTWWSMALLAILPIALRLSLLPHHPVPSPDIYDEFGHLLVADTLRHFRLANPPHALPQFFETFFVLQQPTYSSIYPIGQGLMLALGRAIFGHPWAGVLVMTGAFCSTCYWMLRGWVSPPWALAGGVLAVFEFGPLSSWMNSYWGGSLGAVAGCLVFGALPRLREAGRRRYAIALAAGLGLHLMIRPFESIFLFLAVGAFLAPVLWQRENAKALLSGLPVAAAAVVCALGITVLHNKSVTGSWTTLPYRLSQYQYGVPAALTFQDKPVPHVALTPQQELGYESQLAFRAQGPESLSAFLTRLRYRMRYYRFFFLPALYPAILAFIPAMREWRFAWAGMTLTIFALGTNFFPAFQLHYVAAATCLFVLVSVAGLQQIHRLRPEAAQLLLFLCAAHFCFWFGMHVFDATDVSLAMRRYETWHGINHGNPERRIMVHQQTARLPGQVLIFVRYWPNHIFQDEWVYNEADIDRARVVWARDLGEPENQKLRRYFPNRSVWLLKADARPPELEPYQEVAPVMQPGRPAPAPPKKQASPSQPTLRFEDVR